MFDLRLIQTHSDSFRLIQTHSDSIRLIQTHSDSQNLMEMHQKDIQENDPFGQNGDDDEADDDDDDEKSFLKVLLAERALKNSLFISKIDFYSAKLA